MSENNRPVPELPIEFKTPQEYAYMQLAIKYRELLVLLGRNEADWNQQYKEYFEQQVQTIAEHEEQTTGVVIKRDYPGTPTYED